MTGRGSNDREDRRRFRRLAAGDAAALAEIYDAHAERLFGHALWLTRNRQDAEDTVQNVVVKLAGMGGDLLSVRRPRAYLLQMARREALAALERTANRREDPLDAAFFAVDGADPAARAETADLERRLGRLDFAQREVVFLHLYAGLTFREIGKVTGVPTFTAASRYRLALAKLRREAGQ